MHVQWSTVAVVGIVVVGEIVMGALGFEGGQIAALGTVGALASGIMRAMFDARRPPPTLPCCRPAGRAARGRSRMQ